MAYCPVFPEIVNEPSSCLPNEKPDAKDRAGAAFYVQTGPRQLSPDYAAFPRLILLDLYRPDQPDGLRVLARIKVRFRAQRRPAVPVVVFSHSSLPEDVRACYEHGANAYMTNSSDYRQWFSYFEGLRRYWLETVTLPPAWG